MAVNMIRILLADDHTIITDGLRSLLQNVADIDVIGVAANGERALSALEHLQVDVVMMDLDMPVMDGLTALERIKERHPGVKVIMLSMHQELEIVRRAVELGASGYLLKNCGRDELVLAIRNVVIGRDHFSAELTQQLLLSRQEHDRNNILSGLSGREVEVLAAIAEGSTNKEIGERLFISARTVDTHRTNLMRKLGVHNVAGLVRIALKARLIN